MTMSRLKEMLANPKGEVGYVVRRIYLEWVSVLEYDPLWHMPDHGVISSYVPMGRRPIQTEHTVGSLSPSNLP